MVFWFSRTGPLGPQKKNSLTIILGVPLRKRLLGSREVGEQNSLTTVCASDNLRRLSELRLPHKLTTVLVLTVDNNNITVCILPDVFTVI